MLARVSLCFGVSRMTDESCGLDAQLRAVVKLSLQNCIQLRLRLYTRKLELKKVRARQTFV